MVILEYPEIIIPDGVLARQSAMHSKKWKIRQRTMKKKTFQKTTSCIIRSGKIETQMEVMCYERIKNIIMHVSV